MVVHILLLDYGRENSTLTPKFLSISNWHARTTIQRMAKTTGRSVVFFPEVAVVGLGVLCCTCFI